MIKALAIASVADYRGEVQTVRIIRSKAIGCVASFYAPGWRALGFRTVDGARAKLERHPGFAGWQQS